MPDWSYHTLFKPILEQLPTSFSREFIHKNMSRIASLPGGSRFIHFLGREESSILLEKEIHGIRFANPVGLSGKVDPLLTGTKAFSNLGFGFIEIGPVTKEPNATPQLPTINHKSGLVEFSDNHESIGLDQTIHKLKRHRKKQPLMTRLAGTFEEQIEMMQKLDEFTDIFVVQTDANATLSKTKKPMYLAVPLNQIKELPLSRLAMFDGIVLDELLQETSQSNHRLHLEAIQFLKAHKWNKPIITVGGVTEPDDALQLTNAGADLVLLSGGYVQSGPGLTKRINEALLAEIQPAYPINKAWIWYWLFGLAILLGGIIALIFSLTSIILPYDEQFLGMQKEVIQLFNKRILLFMAHDRMTLAGTMISGGIVYMALARFGVRNCLLWAKQAIDLASILGFLGIFLFIGYGYFDWLHLVFWLVLLPIYLTGFIKTRHLHGTPSSINRTNHPEWKNSLIGQLALVSLGFAFVLGGIIISYIGITEVFVPTDLTYICMPPDMLNSFNENLISVIAHDRAGFGSALLSVGFLVLTLALWGFRQGERWVWWTFLIGGIPAFAAGLSIHFAIEYTTFIHLLPAYIALGLYIIGLVKSYHFFHKRDKKPLT